MIRMQVSGDSALLALIGLRARYALGLGHGAHMAGQLMVRTTHAGMQSAGGGRLYSKARRQSGAPGGYPAVQSGQLLGSIHYEVESISRLTFGSTGAFNKGFDYAIAQEMGTSKMAPRPYIKLTVDKTRAEVARILGDSIYTRIVGG
jgi:hypothetical protein